MAGAGKKTFTAGETLTASDVNTYLMEQSVMYFGGTAARASAIPTPSTGMTSYIGVTGTATIPQLETYTGSAWQTPYGLTQIAHIPLSSAANVTVNNVFTSAYQNYRIVISGVGSLTSASSSYLNLTTGGTQSTSQYFYVVNYVSNSAGPSRFYQASVSSWQPGLIGNLSASIIIDIFRPAQTVPTSFVSQYSCWADASSESGVVSGYHSNGISYDGFSFAPLSGTTSQTIRVYGYRNS